jgi:hypothetical protein
MRKPLLHRFRRAEDGTALVEFAISLPLILVVSFGTIDSMRLFWTYQATVAGVRDAARYVARVAPADICDVGGDIDAALADPDFRLVDRDDNQITNLVEFTDFLQAIIRESMKRDPSDDDVALLTQGADVSNVVVAISCESPPVPLRQAQAPVARVSADMSIAMPGTEVFRLVGGAGFGTLTTRIVEDARVYGI